MNSDSYNGAGPTAVVFPGQGSQRAGMGQDFFQNYSESREVFERASEAVGIDLVELCFSENELLNLTEYTQPAILTTEIAILEALKKRHGFNPCYFAGHSLGEYTALVAAEVLTLEDAVKIVRERGARMQSAVAQGHGAMTALIDEQIPYPEIADVCAKTGCEIANLNSKEQAVISGAREAVRQATELLVSAFATLRAVPLNVSAPFHSRLMESIEGGFAEFLSSFSARMNGARASRVLSNYTGQFHAPKELLGSLVKQLSRPVRWIENMQAVVQHVPHICEVGPQRVLAKFFSSIGVAVSSISDLRSLNKHLGGARASGL